MIGIASDIASVPDLVDGVCVPLWPVHRAAEHRDGEGVAQVGQGAQDRPKVVIDHIVIIHRLNILVWVISNML